MIGSDKEEPTNSSPNQQPIDVTAEIETLLNRLARSTALIQAGGSHLNRLAAQKEAVDACKAFVETFAPATSRDLWLPLQIISNNLYDLGRGIKPEDFVPLIPQPVVDAEALPIASNKSTTQSEYLRLHCAAFMQLYMDSGMTQSAAADRVAYKMRRIQHLTATRVKEWRNELVARSSASEAHQVAYHGIIASLRRRSGGQKPNVAVLNKILELLAVELQGTRLKKPREAR